MAPGRPPGHHVVAKIPCASVLSSALTLGALLVACQAVASETAGRHTAAGVHEATERFQTLPSGVYEATAAEVYEATDVYQTLPWSFEIQRLIAFAVAPLAAVPLPPPTYASKPALGAFASGPAALVAIKFGSDTPIGAYSELFFIPGQFRVPCAQQAYSSVQRIWVDSAASRHAGRSIWGIPKELAVFDWAEGGDPSDPRSSWVSVAVRDAAGREMFSANITDMPSVPGVPLPSWLLPASSRTVVQWPIDDSAHTLLPGDGFAKSRISQFTNANTGPTMHRVLTHLTFSGNATVASASAVHIDAEAFTGGTAARVRAVPLALHLHAGSRATLSIPVQLDSC